MVLLFELGGGGFLFGYRICLFWAWAGNLHSRRFLGGGRGSFGFCLAGMITASLLLLGSHVFIATSQR